MYKGRQTPTIGSNREPFGRRPANTLYGTGPRRPPPTSTTASPAAAAAAATKREASRLGQQPATTEAVPERRRGLRRYKSADLDVAASKDKPTPKKPQAAAVPRRIGFAGKQQSESAIRLDSKPISSHHHQALGPQRSRIPKPVIETELASETMEQYKKNHELEETLATERHYNNKLLKYMKDLELQFEEAKHRQRMAELDVETLQQRASAAEEELEREREARAAAEEKANSLSEVIEAQTHGSGQSAGGGGGGGGGWREGLTQMAKQIGNVHAQCSLMRPESEMDAEALRDMRTVEAYMERGQPRREERVARRRSTALFAGLVRPSGGGGGGGDEACGRCQQLQEAIEALELDNRYYQQANTKLREDLEGIVSRHNALVHLFEKERTRRREARANAAAQRQQQQQLAGQFQLDVK